MAVLRAGSVRRAYAGFAASTRADRPVGWARVELPAGETVRFEVVRVAPDAAVTWPAGPDATFAVPSTGPAVVRVR